MTADIQAQVSAIDKRLATHEAVCEQRQKATLDGLAGLSERVRWMLIAVLFLMVLDVAKSPLSDLVKIAMTLVAH